MIHLVRHADAGPRTATPEDRVRPLSAEGRRQVRALSSWLQPGPNGRVLSSPYLRCVETVDRLAARDGHDLILSDTLAEGGRLDALLDLLVEVPEGSILCTHGDMLRAVIGRLEGDQTLLRGPACSDKGVVWVLLRVGRRFPQAAAIPPLTSRVDALNVVDRMQRVIFSAPASVPASNSS